MVQDAQDLVDEMRPKGKFMNQGKAGNWATHLTLEQVQKLEAWENLNLKESSLKFDFGLKIAVNPPVLKV